MLEAAETPDEKGTWLTRSWSKKNWSLKGPASPREESKLVGDVLPASINPLERVFDDDAREKLDIRRDKGEMEVITCET